MKEISITTDEIQLDQFLKLAGAISTGGEIKFLLSEQSIRKNGETETARRRKLHPGDIIEVEGVGIWKVTRKDL